MSAPRLILASASPRRRELLTQLGVSFDCEPAHIDETPLAGEAAGDYVLRLAQEKATAVARLHCADQVLVLGADTTVVIDGAVLGKPVDYDEGMAMLVSLSGRTHCVLTAICLHGSDGSSVELVETQVEFASLNAEHCAAYLATAEPWDKAGAYAIQGLGGAFIRKISGSYSNVVGLPLFETWQLLAAAGISSALSSGGIAAG